MTFPMPFLIPTPLTFSVGATWGDPSVANYFELGATPSPGDLILLWECGVSGVTPTDNSSLTGYDVLLNETDAFSRFKVYSRIADGTEATTGIGGLNSDRNYGHSVILTPNQQISSLVGISAITAGTSFGNPGPISLSAPSAGGFLIGLSMLGGFDTGSVINHTKSPSTSDFSIAVGSGGPVTHGYGYLFGNDPMDLELSSSDPTMDDFPCLCAGFIGVNL